MAARGCETLVGLTSAASKVPWGGSQGSRRVLDWLPRIDEKPLDPRTGMFTPRWHNFFRALADRVGGVNGPSITTVVESVDTTRALATTTANYASQVSVYAQSVGATAETLKQVAEDNSLAGAGSVPNPGIPPPPPGQDIK